MTARAATIARNDVRLQARSGIYHAYAFVVVFYVVVLVYGGPYLPAWVIGAVVYSDPATVGFFFLGALMMLERSEGSRTALTVTPIAPRDYLAGKMATLVTLGLVAAAIIGWVAHEQVNWPVYLPAVAVTGIMYLCLGVPVALWFRSVTGYMMGSAGFLTPVVAPAAWAFFDPMPNWAMLWPPAAQMRLILVGIGHAEESAPRLALLFALALVGAGACLWAALRALNKEFGQP